MAYSNYRSETHHSSEHSGSSSVHNESANSESAFEIFTASKKFAKLLQDYISISSEPYYQLILKDIANYLLHYQDMRMGAYLLFIQQVYDFKGKTSVIISYK
jgi:hypothetical protein